MAAKSQPVIRTTPGLYRVHLFVICDSMRSAKLVFDLKVWLGQASFVIVVSAGLLAGNSIFSTNIISKTSRLIAGITSIVQASFIL